MWSTSSINLERPGGAKASCAWAERFEGAARRLLGYALEMGREMELAEALTDGPLILEFVFYLTEHRWEAQRGEALTVTIPCHVVPQPVNPHALPPSALQADELRHRR